MSFKKALKFISPAYAIGSYVKDKWGDTGAAGKMGIPEFQEDENFSQLQTFLRGYGQDLLEGRPNDYFGALGQVGGSEFENMLSRTQAGAQRMATEGAARGGRARGGALPSILSKTGADTEANLRFADFQRAMQGRAGLLDVGASMTTGVRDAGLMNQSQVNQFNLGTYDRLFEKLQAEDEYKRRNRSDIMGAFGRIGGAIVGSARPGGAAAGSQLGGSLFGGGQ
jgi:hypothetical protein